MKRITWFVLIFLVFTEHTLAQNTCPSIVRTALQTAADACTALTRNQACYGNVVLQAQPQPDAPSFTFEQAGDIVDLSSISALTLSPMDTKADSWGVALLQTQANLPQTLPGQNVTIVLFGAVNINDASDAANQAAAAVTLPASANLKMNVRASTSNSAPIVGTAAKGDALTASGRNSDNSWIRLLLADNTPGWVQATRVTVNGDIATLPEIDPTTGLATPVYTPMQAFYFRSGAGDSPCASAPDSGILIHTPKGAGTINLLVNEVAITLGSTAYVQAQPGGEMTINIIEGQGTVSAFGTTVTVPAGTRVRITLDANGAANGTPIGPEPYKSLTALPLVLLPEHVAITKPLTVNAISAMYQLDAGDWSISAQASGPLCGTSAFRGVFLQKSGVFYTYQTTNSDASNNAGFWNGNIWHIVNLMLYVQNNVITIPGTYHARQGLNESAEINIISSSRIDGTYDAPQACSLTFTLRAPG